MQGNAAQKTGFLSLVLLLAILYPNITDAPLFARIPHQAALPVSSKIDNHAPILEAIDQPDIRPIHKTIAQETLMNLHPQCLPKLENLYVRYDKPANRGLAGKSSMIIDGTVSHREFRALLVHEFAHIIDLGCFSGNESAGASVFRDGSEIIFQDDISLEFYSFSWINAEVHRPGTRDEDFVSGYAASDPFEDFAETFAYFMLQRNTFRLRASRNELLAKKYNWMRDHFDTLPPAIGQHQWNGRVPWDVTKLPYIWHKTIAAT